MQLATIRKAIEAGAGVVCIGVLEYVTESTDLASWLEQLVPRPLVPLVPVLLGGVALTVRVWRYGNAPSAAAPTVDETAPAPSLLATAPGPLPAPAAPAATPPAAHDAATGAADVATAPQLPELRDPAAAAAWAVSVGTPQELAKPAPAAIVDEPQSAPPTSFIPLPTR